MSDKEEEVLKRITPVSIGGESIDAFMGEDGRISTDLEIILDGGK